MAGESQIINEQILETATDTISILNWAVTICGGGQRKIDLLFFEAMVSRSHRAAEQQSM